MPTKKPRTPDARGYGISTTFYLPNALYQRLVAVADADQRSVSQIGVMCLEADLPTIEARLRKQGLLPPAKKS